jgi:hypothetical protein
MIGKGRIASRGSSQLLTDWAVTHNGVEQEAKSQWGFEMSSTGIRQCIQYLETLLRFCRFNWKSANVIWLISSREPHLRDEERLRQQTGLACQRNRRLTLILAPTLCSTHIDGRWNNHPNFSLFLSESAMTSKINT